MDQDSRMRNKMLQMKGLQGYASGRGFSGRQADLENKKIIFVDNTKEDLFQVYDDLANEEFETNKKEHT